MAVLLTPPVVAEADKNYCLEFYSHHYGEDIGKVAVLVSLLDRIGDEAQGALNIVFIIFTHCKKRYTFKK